MIHPFGSYSIRRVEGKRIARFVPPFLANSEMHLPLQLSLGCITLARSIIDRKKVLLSGERYHRRIFSDVTITALIGGSSSFAKWYVSGLNSSSWDPRSIALPRYAVPNETDLPASTYLAIERFVLRRWDLPDFRSFFAAQSYVNSRCSVLRNRRRIRARCYRGTLRACTFV